MHYAPEGRLPALVLAAAAAGAWFVSPILTALICLPLALTLWFYRDPDRTPEGGPDDWVSPADGKVVEVIEGAEDLYAGRTTKIGIFMNGFDVHVNRVPTSGTVAFTRYVPGKKWFAINPKASEENERFYVGFDTPYGRTTVVQIAGILARRIVRKVSMGDTFARGERYGMIKLGSKVDVYLPAGIVPAVKVGDIVKAGKTVVAVKCRGED